MVIEPSRAQMSPEQVRAFARGVMALYASIVSGSDPVDAEDDPS